jgi:hypothetical protein
MPIWIAGLRSLVGSHSCSPLGTARWVRRTRSHSSSFTQRRSRIRSNHCGTVQSSTVTDISSHAWDLLLKGLVSSITKTRPYQLTMIRRQRYGFLGAAASWYRYIALPALVIHAASFPLPQCLLTATESHDCEFRRDWVRRKSRWHF